MGNRFSFAHLSIARRLGIGFALAGLLAVITALAVGIANTAAFQESTQSFNQALRGSLNLSQIRFDLEDIHSILDDRLAFGKQSSQPALSDQIKNLSDDLDQQFVNTLVLVGQDVPQLDSFDLTWATYRQLALNAAFLLDSQHQGEVDLGKSDLAAQGQTTFNVTLRDLATLVTLNQQQVDVVQARANQINVEAFWGSLGLALAGFLAVLFLAWFTVRSITRQLDQLLRLTRLVNQGNLSQRVSIAGRSEIAMVASSMNDMLDTIGDLLGKEETLRSELEEQIELLIREVTPVGQGDLRTQAEVTHAQIGVLADVFNLIIGQLATLVARVQSSASMTHTASSSIVQEATDLAKAAERQAAQLAQASDGMGELAMASVEVARLARVSTVTATETVASAQRGGKATFQVLEQVRHGTDQMRIIADQMQILGNHSREITAIVGLIEGIAKQTQLLSLNAEVQAGQAGGDFNRGFGVVAEEIRRLAERTEDAVHQITMLVRTVQGDIYSVVTTTEQTVHRFSSLAKLMDEASSTLQTIWTAVAQQAKDIDEITQVAAWQESVAGSAAGMIRSLATMARGMGEIAYQQEDAARNLSGISQSLQSSITAFRLPPHLQPGLLARRQDSEQLLLPRMDNRSTSY